MQNRDDGSLVTRLFSFEVDYRDLGVCRAASQFCLSRISGNPGLELVHPKPAGDASH